MEKNYEVEDGIMIYGSNKSKDLTDLVRKDRSKQMKKKIAEIHHEIDINDITMWGGVQTEPPEFIIFDASEIKFNRPESSQKN